MKSWSRVLAALAPTPPRFCFLYSVNAVRLMYPAWEIVMTTSESGIISSMLTSPPEYSISVLRSSPNLSLTSSSSSLMIDIRNALSFKMLFKYSIVFINSSYSALILSRSRPVSFWRRMSKIALAWISLSLNSVINPVFASSGVDEARMSLMTASRLSMAMSKPSRTWARFSACFSSYSVRRTTTSCLWSTKWRIMSLRFNNSGRPLTSAMLFTENELWSCVYLYSLLRTTLGTASRFKTYTIRIPLRSLSSRISEMPSSFLSLTNSAVFLIISALFTKYGISVTIIHSRPLTSSITALPRNTIRPRPVWKASRTPS